jgi:hypothetical protein
MALGSAKAIKLLEDAFFAFGGSVFRFDAPEPAR